ncbi:MAG: hypothetical protein ACLPVY_17490 [Acidimicrobiia bacterium]
MPGGVVELRIGLDPPSGRRADGLDEPLQAAASTNIATTAAASHKRLQARNHRVDSTVMEARQFYRDAPASSDRPAPVSRADLEARVAELERVVATLAALHDERLVDRRTERPDPVALTRALHPRGMRRSRNTKRGSSTDGTLSVRAVLFQPPSSR